MRRTRLLLVPALVVPLLLASNPLAPAALGSAAPTCRGLAATIVGSPGGGYLRGTSGPDVIVGSADNDKIKGHGGDDVICGGGGQDLVNGQRGDDRIYGGPGGDGLESSRGSDELRGGPGDDNLTGWSLQPTRIYGGSGSDALRGYVTVQPGYVFAGGGDLDDLNVTALGAGAPVEVRRGSGTISRDGSVTGLYRGVEFLGASGLSAFVYYGTDERDFVIAMTDGLPFRAETFDGPDYIDSRATGADDHVDAGPGDDVVKAGPGDDVCLSAEKAKGCEVLGP